MALKVDVNCLIGNWPFRKLYKNKKADLMNVHSENGIDIGFVSSLDAVFYNDPFEADEDLHKLICDTKYAHVMTINPTLPDFQGDILRGIKEFDIKGVRIYPGYHQYELSDSYSCVDEFMAILKEHKLPLFLVLRMEDERLNHIVTPNPIKLEQVEAFIEKHISQKIILLNARFAELIQMSDCINKNENVHFDIAFLGHNLFAVEKLLEKFHTSKFLYGSSYPLNCLKSSILSLKSAEISQKDKETILGAGQLIR